MVPLSSFHGLRLGMLKNRRAFVSRLVFKPLILIDWPSMQKA
ncbi:hypothetical protein BH10PLA2_BH10PLA2_07560 [soil metagenome]